MIAADDDDSLLPAIAFTLDMERRTGGYFGINEALFSSALAAVVFSIFAVQPLTVVGITGLISLFNYTIYDIVAEHDVSLYPQVMVWVSIWTAITHWMCSFGNLCDYMRYITDFSSNTFAMYVGIIYVGEYTLTYLLGRQYSRLDRKGSAGVHRPIHEWELPARLLQCLSRSELHGYCLWSRVHWQHNLVQAFR